MSRSPYDITPNDMIAYCEQKLAYLERTKAGRVLQGQNAEMITREIETLRKMAKVMKQHKKDPQGNLFDVFNQSKR